MLRGQTTMPTLNQAALPLDLFWTQGDLVHEVGTLAGKAAWATGAHSVVSDDPTLRDFLTFTFVASGNDALVTVDLAADKSALLPVGKYEYRVKSAAGLTYCEGVVHIFAGANDVPIQTINPTLITPADVFEWMDGSKNIAAISDDNIALMQKVVSAVIARISRGWEAPTSLPDDDWKLAHVMQSARIWKRKSSPEGVIDNSAFGAIRVTRIDADIADFLNDFKKAPFPSSEPGIVPSIAPLR